MYLERAIVINVTATSATATNATATNVTHCGHFTM